LRLALEQGHSVVTSSLLDEAMARLMPKRAPLDKLAEAVAIGRSQEQAVAVCNGCGLTAREPDPVLCSVCGGTSFDILTAEMVESLVASEGGAADEPSYDGRHLKWTKEARRAMLGIEDAYLRRRSKARIEKSARLRRLKTVTLEFAGKLIEEETGLPFVAAPETGPDVAEPIAESAAGEKTEPAAGEKRLVAREAGGAPLFSELDWTEDATARIQRVPAGFMRERTQARIEELARERGSRQIDLECVEAGIELGLKLMAEMVSQNDAESGQQGGDEPAAAAKCPAVLKRGSEAREPLNEVSPINELAAMRMLLKASVGESAEVGEAERAPQERSEEK
jgi:hypothetical protein